MGVISAVRQNNVARIRAFISAGAINNMNPINEAALINACKFGYIEIARLLIDVGIVMNTNTHDGRAALRIAEMLGNAEGARLLAEAGAGK